MTAQTLTSQIRATKAARGLLAYHTGRAAEDSVARNYLSRGFELSEKRWRGKSGEIDLIFKTYGEFQNEIVFVEVKKAKSFAAAAQRITARQQARICAAAEEYLCNQPLGLLTPMRVDAAFVNGSGEIEVLENAMGA
jgi:putative endonuclease